ncbi:23S rRNA (adenine(1618)-N(6))-methyltransferase RlmF [Spongiivirga citrea]|uniref:23S rRNA (Adenine(1618)-N(6))-methyltransferase RlmF n=1 Tax=Spongiivirga citrea TaxID=1481457 RepID=A0A6M0CL80_9FLAO|nr:23S rRNA (adenine(1618)-N(6))-methyltransferase RlmF [Spongiivirga citrea]NER16609.1 23S rRNA (adenine(1618)-N(6))-methyltransferase RlmF [Spongiivirga citrea]
MHAQNPYDKRYDLKRLTKHYLELQEHIVLNPAGEETIDFSSSSAVYALNKAILLTDFELADYHLPRGYLIPPIPGRLDYLLYIRDFLSEHFKSTNTNLRGLDIGTGANGIYCILGAQHFKWNMVGTESSAKAIDIARMNVRCNKKVLQDTVELRYQENNGFLFKNIIQPSEQFDFTICNPPFHNSKEEAIKGSIKKLENLGGVDKKEYSLNFEGQANELWCNGGETLFIKRLIKESVLFKDQVKLFSSLVAKKDSLFKIEKQLKKVKANYHIIPMVQGHKKGRYVLWWFD